MRLEHSETVVGCPASLGWHAILRHAQGSTGVYANRHEGGYWVHMGGVSGRRVGGVTAEYQEVLPCGR